MREVKEGYINRNIYRVDGLEGSILLGCQFSPINKLMLKSIWKLKAPIIVYMHFEKN